MHLPQSRSPRDGSNEAKPPHRRAAPADVPCATTVGRAWPYPALWSRRDDFGQDVERVERTANLTRSAEVVERRRSITPKLGARNSCSTSFSRRPAGREDKRSRRQDAAYLENVAVFRRVAGVYSVATFGWI